RRFDIPFLFMSYYNVLFRYGVREFVAKTAELGLQGLIVPDLPPEEAQDYLAAAQASQVAPIFIYAPSTSEARLSAIADVARGFIYCVARKGVTGADTQFEAGIDDYLARCRRATDLPLALGFGVKSRADVDFLRGKVDIAVVGSQTLRVLDEQGSDAAVAFIASLR